MKSGKSPLQKLPSDSSKSQSYRLSTLRSAGERWIRQSSSDCTQNIRYEEFWQPWRGLQHHGVAIRQQGSLRDLAVGTYVIFGKVEALSPN